MAKKQIDPDVTLGFYPNLTEFKTRFEVIIGKSHANFIADWFLKLVEKPDRSEAPKVVQHKKGSRWEWPYEDRVLYLFHKFINLDEDYKNYIIAAAEDGVHWRGDEKESFYNIVAENEKMRLMGAEKYREEALLKMKHMFRGFGK